MGDTIVFGDMLNHHHVVPHCTTATTTSTTSSSATTDPSHSQAQSPHPPLPPKHESLLFDPSDLPPAPYLNPSPRAIQAYQPQSQATYPSIAHNHPSFVPTPPHPAQYPPVLRQQHQKQQQQQQQQQKFIAHQTATPSSYLPYPLSSSESHPPSHPPSHPHPHPHPHSHTPSPSSPLPSPPAVHAPPLSSLPAPMVSGGAQQRPLTSSSEAAVLDHNRPQVLSPPPPPPPPPHHNHLQRHSLYENTANNNTHFQNHAHSDTHSEKQTQSQTPPRTIAAVMQPSAKSILERRARAVAEGRRQDAKLSDAERRIVRRLRNRESAERCRLRRMEQMRMLERRIDAMQQENERLEVQAQQFRATIQQYQHMLMDYTSRAKDNQNNRCKDGKSKTAPCAKVGEEGGGRGRGEECSSYLQQFQDSQEAAKQEQQQEANGRNTGIVNLTQDAMTVDDDHQSINDKCTSTAAPLQTSSPSPQNSRLDDQHLHPQQTHAHMTHPDKHIATQPPHSQERLPATTSTASPDLGQNGTSPFVLPPPPPPTGHHYAAASQQHHGMASWMHECHRNDGAVVVGSSHGYAQVGGE